MICRFVKGKNTLDLAASPYAPGDDFLPPPTVMVPNIATGTGLDPYAGGELMSETAQNREYEFSIRIIVPTESAAAVREAVRRVTAFLADSDDLFLEFSQFDIPEPLWGQLGAVQRYPVVHADTPALSEHWLDGKLRAKGIFINLSLILAPFALGRPQRAASAMGGIFMDTIGAGEGEAWGLRVPEATTNKITNPTWSHWTTWYTGWTAGADIVAAVNVDEQYCFPGSGASALLISKGATNTYIQSIAAGNTNKHSFSAIVRRKDGAAVTSADCVLFYNVALATTFLSLGNGFYLAYSDNVTGIAAATATGVSVLAGHSIYLVGYQMEEKAYHTPITYGDLLGNAWTGTAGESSTTRAAGKVSLAVAADTFSNALWAVHFVWKPDYASTAAGDRYMFSLGAANIRCYYTAADDKFNLTDNTNAAATGAAAFSIGDVIEGLAVGGNSGLALYIKNQTTGNSYSGTNATYTIPATATSIFIGTDAAGANHAGGIFQLFETYSDDLTSAQNTAIQAVVAAAGGRKVGDIPWFWVKDGDNITDNTNDSKNDFGVAGGVPGDMPAETVLEFLGSGVSDTYISLLDAPYYVDPTAICNIDATPYAVIDSGWTFWLKVGISTQVTRALLGREVRVIASMSDTGTGLNMQLAVSYMGVNAYSVTAPCPSATSPTFNLVLSPPLTLLNFEQLDPHGDIGYFSSTINFELTRLSGTNDVTVRFYQLMPSPLMKIPAANDGGTTAVIYNGDEARGYSTGLHYHQIRSVLGDSIELVPRSYNSIISLQGNASTMLTTTTITWRKLIVTPRWRLL